MAASAPAVEVGTDIVVPNFPGMHKVYLGRYSTDSSVSVDVSQLLPDLYSRLVAFNFSFEPVSVDVVQGSASDASSTDFTYDAVSGVLSCPFLRVAFQSKSYAYIVYDVFCYYNDSVSSDSVQPGVTNFVYTSYNPGQDIDFPGFPGLHRRYVAYCPTSSFYETSCNASTYFPDLFSLFTHENFSFVFTFVASPNSNSLLSPSFVNASFDYDSSTGLLSVSKCYNYLGTGYITGKTRSCYAAFGAQSWVFYNDESEMVLPEPTPTPSPIPSPTPAPSDTPDTPVASPHPFWTTPFTDYTVSEGLLLLIFSLFSIFIVIKVFLRR